MSIVEFIVLLIVAGVCGAIGQAITGYSSGGCLVSIGIGFVGAILGVWLARQMGLPEFFTFTFRGTTFPIVWSILGSALFVAIITLLGGARRRR